MKNEFKITAAQQGNKAVISIDGYISNWHNSSSRIKFEIENLIKAGITDADVYINSPGGDVFEAAEISNIIKKFTGTITARLGALCASAATYIACNCSTVIAAKNTSYMIHKPSATLDGNADEIQARIKLLRDKEKDYAQTYATKTGKTVAQIEALWIQENWMTAGEAETLGFVDKVEGEADITASDVTALSVLGYKKAPKITASTNLQPTDKMKEKLVLILASVPGVTITASSSDDSLLAIVEGLKAKAITADTLKLQLDAATAKAMADNIKAVLDGAETKKQITPAQRAYYEKQLKANFDETKAHIESLPGVTALSSIPAGGTGGGNPTGEDRSKWTYADYQEKAPEALAKLSVDDEAKFKELFKAHYGKDC